MIDEPLHVDLPWPPAALKPNGSHGSYHAKSKAAEKYRADCMILCRAAGLSKVEATAAHLSLSFRPPDNRRRDLDNMFASVKHGIDAIAQTLGIDDYHFSYTIGRGQPEKGGRVAVKILEEV